MCDHQMMKLLFVTQKISADDDDLGFVILWVNEFIRQGYEVDVICLEEGKHSASFPVHSLGKERGYGIFLRSLRFLYFTLTLRYDRVFVHMNPEYVTLGGWWWFVRGIPTYLWYTHYMMNIHMRLSGMFTRRMFAATPQSMPQFEGNPKKVIVGHGIDMDFWLQGGESVVQAVDETKLLTVHRISRSKRVEIGIEALTHLPEQYSLSIYGRPIDPPYADELHRMVDEKGLSRRVEFKGPVPPETLRTIYAKHRLFVNLASETIDKTMVECMLFGLYPVTTPANSRAIGLPVYPNGETPKDIAEFIEGGLWRGYSASALQEIVRTGHSLSALISKMSAYIKEGK
jgi:glycosyltransferase involved in cell wall biosynthesis